MIAQFDREIGYVVRDLAAGSWHERQIGRLMRWYWNRRRLTVVESDLERLGYRGGFLPDG